MRRGLEARAWTPAILYAQSCASPAARMMLESIAMEFCQMMKMGAVINTPLVFQFLQMYSWSHSKDAIQDIPLMDEYRY